MTVRSESAQWIKTIYNFHMIRVNASNIEVLRTRINVHTEQSECLIFSIFDMQFIKATFNNAFIIVTLLGRFDIHYNQQSAHDVVKRILHQKYKFLITVCMDTPEDRSDSNICPICMDELETDTVSMPCCQVAIHTECFAQLCVELYVSKRTSGCWHRCPICRDQQCPFH